MITSRTDPVRLEFAGELFHWRGPAPFWFVAVPDEECRLLHEESSAVSYGWGMIPVHARIGVTDWATSLFPKDGGYLVPVKVAVRRAEALDAGDRPTVVLTLRT